MSRNEMIVHSGFRGLRYVDGRFDEVLSPGRYPLPKRGRRRAVVAIVPIDVRERELNIKGQEILTADKVAVRVNIITHFRVTDPRAAVEQVADYADRIYSDVQLAARCSLASMTLEAILTNRNQLSEDILRDVEGVSAGYGVQIIRADVKDLVFPGNLQEIMNRVLAAERMSQAQLVEARTKADTHRIDAQVKAETQRIDAQVRADAHRAEAEAQAAAMKLAAQAEAEAIRVKTEAEIGALREREQAAEAYSAHPALLRLQELETLRALARTANARIYIGFDKHRALDSGATRGE
jgi:regulator of protease activity HflC (stomatin/prohibitin superfamily)